MFWLRSHRRTRLWKILNNMKHSQIWNQALNIMEKLNKLGSSPHTVWKKAADLKIKKYYKILDAEKTKGKFGVQVILQTGKLFEF